MRILAFIAALVLGSIPVNGHAAAGARVALVIGNGDYVSAADMPLLPNPSNDAQAMASKLRTLDFDVIEVRDGTYGAMIDGLRRFSREASGAEVALFYYAGHGLQADGENYLMPVDAEIEIPADLNYESLVVSRIREELVRANPNVSVIILDACRNNPLSRSLARNAKALGRSVTTDQGLARMAGASGMLIAYATDPNNVALDGQGDNSPFTSALLKHLGDPVDARVMFGRVREKVVNATNGAQTPWVEESVIGEFSLAVPRRPQVDIPEVSEEGPLGGGGTADAPEQTVELAFWASIRQSKNVDDFEAYLDSYPNGAFARLAENRIAALTPDQPAPETTEPDPVATPQAIEEQLDLGRSEIRQAQRALRHLGHDPGYPDGLMGPNTRSAIRRFQTNRGQNVTGYLNEPQWVALHEHARAIPQAEVPRSADDILRSLRRVLEEGQRRIAAAGDGFPYQWGEIAEAQCAIRDCNEALNSISRLGEPKLRARAYSTIALELGYAGRTDTARRWLARARDAASTLSTVPEFAGWTTDRQIALLSIAEGYVQIGDIAEARQIQNRLPREMHPRVLASIASYYERKGYLGEALKVVRDLREMSEDDAKHIVVLKVLAASARDSEARRIVRRSKYDYLEDLHFGVIAEGLVSAGRVEEAMAIAADYPSQKSGIEFLIFHTILENKGARRAREYRKTMTGPSERIVAEKIIAIQDYMEGNGDAIIRAIDYIESEMASTQDSSLLSVAYETLAAMHILKGDTQSALNNLARVPPDDIGAHISVYAQTAKRLAGTLVSK